MTSYRTKYSVYFKKDLIRTEILRIPKTALVVIPPHSGGIYNELECGGIYNEFVSGGI